VCADWTLHVRALDASCQEMKRHRLLLLVKGLHEIGHILTPIFMERLGMKKKSKVYVTPIMIGTMKSGVKKRTIGDAGYGLEECLTGGRMFHEHPKCDALFAIEALVVEKKSDDGRWKQYEVSDDFLKKKMRTLRAHIIGEKYLMSVKDKASVHKRKSAELFIPTDLYGSSSFRCTTSPNKYRRV